MRILDLFILLVAGWLPVYHLVVYNRSPEQKPTRSEKAGIIGSTVAMLAYLFILLRLNYFF